MSGVLSEVATRLPGYAVDETSPPKHSTCQVFYLKWLRGYVDIQWMRTPPLNILHVRCFIWSGYAATWIYSGWDLPPQTFYMSGVLSEVATRLRGYTVDETSPPKHSTCQVFYLKWLRGYVDIQWMRPPPLNILHVRCFIWSGYAATWIRSGWDLPP